MTEGISWCAAWKTSWYAGVPCRFPMFGVVSGSGLSLRFGDSRIAELLSSPQSYSTPAYRFHWLIETLGNIIKCRASKETETESSPCISLTTRTSFKCAKKEPAIFFNPLEGTTPFYNGSCTEPKPLPRPPTWAPVPLCDCLIAACHRDYLLSHRGTIQPLKLRRSSLQIFVHD
jgi:hypothetical protein